MNTPEHKQKIESFTDLEAQKSGHKLVIDIYHATVRRPSPEVLKFVHNKKETV